MTEQSTRAHAQIPWEQRELNARLALRALRREAVRRFVARAVGAGALAALGLLLVLAMAQDQQGRLALRARRAHRGAVPARVGLHPALAAAGELRARGATLTLDPPGPGAVAAGNGATLRVTATDRVGAPLAGITIWLTITGPLPYRGAAATDAAGVARFPYRGGAGPYIVQITATAGGSQVARSTVRVGAEPTVATSAVTGRFYASDDRCAFDTPANTPPLLVERFATLDFAGRPFTGYGSWSDARSIPAVSGAVAVGVGRLNHFNAVFTGSLVVRRTGDVPFTILVDDAFTLGIGGGAGRVAGTLVGPPAGGLTALERLPVAGAFNQGHLAATTSVRVRFPHAGRYPYEIDYAECAGGGAALRVASGGRSLPGG